MYRLLIVLLLAAALTACLPPPPVPLPRPPRSPTPPVQATPSAPPEATAPSPVTLEPTYDLTAEEVTFDAAGTTVHGTLTRPSAAGPFPALLFIAGSGPTDRDWKSSQVPGDNGSGRLLAEDLSRRGVVVLRYDKRGTGKTAFPGTLSWDDYLAEQRAGLALLASHEAVELKWIYPAGHSMGGVNAIKLAKDPGTPLAGLILMSTPGRTMMETVLGQIRDQIRLGDVSAEREEQLVGGLRTVLEQCAAGEEMDFTLLGGDMGVLSMAMAFKQKAAQAFIQEVLVFDPAAELGESDLPVLILNGDRDIQVKPDRDADPLEAAARKAGVPVIRLDIPEADHVLKKETTPIEDLGPHMAINYNAEGRELHPLVVETIAGWLIEASNP